MAGNWIIHEFNHYDWRMGIKELQKVADERYGHQEGYSGAINVISDFKHHRPHIQFKNKKQLYDYIDVRGGNLRNGSAEVIDLGLTCYSIAKPVIREYSGHLPINLGVFKGGRGPAVLLNKYALVVGYGTLSELKDQAKKLVLKERFENDYYIVSKNTHKTYVVTGEGKQVKTTKRKSTLDTLVLTYHDWIVYGWASC